MLDGSEQADYRFIARAKKFSFAAGIFIMLVGAVALAGWLLDITRFKSIHGDITMKANTALLLVLSGLSLCLLNLNPEKKALRIAAMVCAAIVAVLGLLTLSEHLIGWNLGIDQLLFEEPQGALATASPGRMGPPGSSCFTFAGLALLLLHSRKAIRLSQVLSILVCLWSLLAMVGFVYRAEQLYEIAKYTGIALPTSVALFVLGLGLLAARVNSGITSVISSSHLGGQRPAGSY